MHGSSGRKPLRRNVWGLRTPSMVGRNPLRRFDGTSCKSARGQSIAGLTDPLLPNYLGDWAPELFGVYDVFRTLFW